MNKANLLQEKKQNGQLRKYAFNIFRSFFVSSEVDFPSLSESILKVTRNMLKWRRHNSIDVENFKRALNVTR